MSNSARTCIAVGISLLVALSVGCGSSSPVPVDVATTDAGGDAQGRDANLTDGDDTQDGQDSHDARDVQDAQADGHRTEGTCDVVADCGASGGGACIRSCNDGSNPCAFACVEKKCVSRGCPEDTADAGPSECSPPCGAGKTCVKKQFNGGAQLKVDDAGACPAGKHPSGDFCVSDPTFACAKLPAACGATVTCACASSLCESYSCVGASAGQVSCQLNAP